MSNGIRAGLEVRRKAVPPGAWSAIVPSIDVDEVPNRTLFALLAGYPSRLGLEPNFSLRGLPSDVTRRIKELYDEWDGDVHDASWVSYEELVATVERMTAVIEETARNQGIDVHELRQLHCSIGIDAVIAFLSIYCAYGYEARMVFWFTPL